MKNNNFIKLKELENSDSLKSNKDFKRIIKEFSDHRKFINKISIKEFIKVDKEMLDGLNAIVTELIINKNNLLKFAKLFNNKELLNISQNINKIAEKLNDSFAEVNFLNLSNVFQRYPLIIKNFAKGLKKKIIFKYFDNGVVIEQNIANTVGEILIHLIKNSLSHGIELPGERRKKNKVEKGTLILESSQVSNYVIIKIIDDGKGLDKEKIIQKAINNKLYSRTQINDMTDNEIYGIVFQPGFSTAESVDNLSGRGVGMDAVNDTITKLGGNILIESEKDKGATIILKIPFKMIVKELLFVKLFSKEIAFTLDYISDIIYYNYDKIVLNKDGMPYLNYKNNQIPLWLFEDEIVDLESIKYLNKGVIFKSHDKLILLPVVDIVEQTKAIIKSIHINMIKDKFRNVIGYTIFDNNILFVYEPEFNGHYEK